MVLVCSVLSKVRALLRVRGSLNPVKIDVVIADTMAIMNKAFKRM